MSGRCCRIYARAEKASAFQATLISDQLSRTKSVRGTSTEITRQSPGRPESPAPTGLCCSSAGGHDCGRSGSGRSYCSSKVPETTDLKSLLCYSCTLTVRDMSTVNHLPQYILSEAQRRQRRSQMREEIGEFLLDDHDEGN